MKKTLTLLAMMIALAGAGQGMYQNYNRLPLNITISPKYDTLPILYLYADTARLMSIGEGWYIKGNIAFIERDTSYYPPHFYAFWDFGYEVRERNPFWFYPEHITYLDRHKNPIRKSIVLFMTKTIDK